MRFVTEICYCDLGFQVRFVTEICDCDLGFGITCDLRSHVNRASGCVSSGQNSEKGHGCAFGIGVTLISSIASVDRLLVGLRVHRKMHTVPANVNIPDKDTQYLVE